MRDVCRQWTHLVSDLLRLPGLLHLPAPVPGGLPRLLGRDVGAAAVVKQAWRLLCRYADILYVLIISGSIGFVLAMSWVLANP